MRFIKIMFLLIVVAYGLNVVGASAQTTGSQTDADNPFEADAPLAGQQLVPVQPRNGGLTDSPTSKIERPDVAAPQSIDESVELDRTVLPFGSQLFSKANFIDRSQSVNDAYTIKNGDRVAIKMWGARVYENILTVDLQGNIFLPEVGPVQVAGLRNSELDGAVNKRVSSVFTNNVKVYTNLLGTQPIGIFVTGNVAYPGRYPGNRGDSVLYYLARAGGVDPDSGSYRTITVRRGGKALGSIDLYNFLINGDLQQFDFQDNDTILVGPQHPTVTVIGDVKNIYKYEFDPTTYSGADILALANPKGTASHVMLKGVRGNQSFSQFLPLAQARGARLFAGDILTVASDQAAGQILLKVKGNSVGPSTLAVNRAMNLGQVASLIQTDPVTHDLDAIYIRRLSVAERQKRAIEQSLYELQRSVLTASASSSSGSAILAQEAQLIDRFVQQARAVEPEGRVVLAGVDWSKMHLEDGDEIVIPERTDVVFISGEVKVPQTILWRKDYSPDDYIGSAGGLSNRGDDDRLIIVRRNGSVQDGSDPIERGDHIMVLPTYDTKVFAMFKDLIEITYRVALSAAVVLNSD